MIDKKKYEERFSAFTCSDHKPLEVYLFIDPLCSDCWDLEPIIKKLQIEYGHYFSLTYVLSGKLTRLNPPSNKKKIIEKDTPNQKIINKKCIDCDDVKSENHQSSPFLASVAMKAAELQGRKSGIRFLRKLQEYLFFKQQDITKLDTLITCANEAHLDVDEFIKDIHSDSTSHAFQCDLKITNEMDVEEIPSLVFFNNNVDEAGIKLSGVNSYKVYVEIMTEILGEKPVNHSLPPLLSFLKHYQTVTTQEIAYVYNWTFMRVEMEMKKLLLLQEVDMLQSDYGTIWRYLEKHH